ncbi:MAG: GNAT family N-acetyltransferase [Gammaproteobacteria bacterium]|nr:GNAT family N-acetyltransferase [Gammaproteobacteria bacterium]
MSVESSPVTLRAADWRHDHAALCHVRRVVFIDEQQVPEDLEWDGEDSAAQHWLAWHGSTPIGTVRLRAGGHIGRMAVLKEYRKHGVGSRLLGAAIEAARMQGLTEVHLDAQVQALKFYARHGFVSEGEEFMDAGIAHRAMRLELR